MITENHEISQETGINELYNNSYWLTIQKNGVFTCGEV